MHLLPFGRHICGKNWSFQQDNASIHVAGTTLEWFQKRKVRKIDWPSLSPDLNPIENLWGILSRKAYANGRQYNTVEELKMAIYECWEDIPIETLQTLVKSMPKRTFEMILKHGSSINY